MKPTIGITPEPLALNRKDGNGVFLGQSYIRAIEQAGGLPVILPLTADAGRLGGYLKLCHGFLISGGGDFTEQSGAYAAPLPVTVRTTLSGLDPVRDAMELTLLREAVQRDIPVLGICRGCQALNVALGGTLHADVPNHRHPDPFALAHPVTWTAPGDWPAMVNTTHHQALDRVAQPLRVLARAADGIIEAVDVPGRRYCVGTQFHPERLWDSEPRSRQFFIALVRAAMVLMD